MSNRCVHCNEAWDYEDYQCPCCGQCTVEQDNDMRPTLKYTFVNEKGHKVNPHTETRKFEHEGQMVNFIYDVIRKSTGKSVFDESENYMNEEESA